MKKAIYLFLSLVVVSIASCKKEDPPADDNTNDTIPPKALVYDSLTTSPLVHLNEVVDVVAFADGDELVYTWAIDIGALLGTGDTVVFTACCEGIHNITCTVSDKYGASQSKSITIKVIS